MVSVNRTRRIIPATRAAWLVLGTLCACAPAARAQEAAPSREGVEFFETHIRPVLVEKCYACHSEKADKLRGDFLLDTREGLRKGGGSGEAAVVPGEPDKSPLILAIRRNHDDHDAMPPKEKDALTAEQVKAFEQWVTMGAPDPRDGKPTSAAGSLSKVDPKQHWAFRPVKDVAVPEVRSAGWAITPIDRFILAKLEEKNLPPSPLADKLTLIRRATFDLTGLPPTPAEVEAFVNDESPDAYEKLIDRLLASPAYGERWARHWLDVARYADSKGYVFQEERKYPYAYTYRDWVIRALNEDMPYDQFLVRQIAADKLNDEDKSHLAAMGFLTVGRRFLNNQPDIIDDRIDVVTRGAMALTVQCARCHDHKYDPIPIDDYYSLYGVFASSREPGAGELPLIGKAEENAANEAFQKELAKRQAAVDEFLKKRHDELAPKLRTAEGLKAYFTAIYDFEQQAEKDRQDERRFGSGRDLSGFVLGRWRAALQKRREAGHDPVFAPFFAYAALKPAEFAEKAKEVTERVIEKAPADKAVHPLVAERFAGKPPASFAEVAERYGQLLAEFDKPEPLPDARQEAIRLVLRAEDAPVTVSLADTERLLRRDMRNEFQGLKRKVEEFQANNPNAPPRAMVMVDAEQPVKPRVFNRGNAANPGKEVPRQFLSIVTGEKREPFKEGSGRLEMARAVASADNPLTARVIVNRVWGWHFGAGLVATPSDFGVRSDPPSHPELLDYLAQRFVNGDWPAPSGVEGPALSERSESKWSLKKLHREIMRSAVYRQTSALRPDGESADPENRLLWRMNRLRLDFEAMRDNVLAVSGSLDRKVGGRAVDINGFSPRRTIYGFIDRQNLPGMFRSFDFASPDQHTPQRFITVVPQQALYMMNSPFVVGEARKLAARPEVAGESDPAKRVEALYRLLFARPPVPDEVEMALEFIRAEEAKGGANVAATTSSPWRYGVGRYDAGQGRLADFQPLAHFEAGKWQGGRQLPDAKLGWVVLTADGGHPGNDAAHAAIRRWTAPADGTYAVSGKLSHKESQGDGVLGRIVSSRDGELASYTVNRLEAETKIDGIRLKQGDTLDFLVEPRTGPGWDSFAWAPTIRRTDKAPVAGEDNRNTEWSSARDFAGPASAPTGLSPWEEYAHVLLQTNEFVYVD